MTLINKIKIIFVFFCFNMRKEWEREEEKAVVGAFISFKIKSTCWRDLDIIDISFKAKETISIILNKQQHSTTTKYKIKLIKTIYNSTGGISKHCSLYELHKEKIYRGWFEN